MADEMCCRDQPDRLKFAASFERSGNGRICRHAADLPRPRCRGSIAAISIDRHPVGALDRGRRNERLSWLSPIAASAANLQQDFSFRLIFETSLTTVRHARPVISVRGSSLFSLFLQEIISDGPLPRRRNARSPAASVMKEQRDNAGCRAARPLVVNN